ncbi:hypothetical protein CS344_23865 [Bordetella bronchiseptica]|uniref:hypothetical protein n=1 Tax=Bordetella bronchiseptica TaxID=518 RepID=UPI0004A075C0|nr:hypothetical protein [Bordetella bronchiseptica]AZW14917.1 hypothetical protein CS344_23865 [Bordetella bronchiseptica]KDC64169.1 hypothetical protein L512_4979 [Bordetella bronchiseptica MBORD624]KDD60577.1 hypothetical protein L536_4822 [Bordetella bronchiseptica SO10328]QBS71452.1 hypothetical protein B2C13_23560 [Bordetella bronchiseptica]
MTCEVAVLNKYAVVIAADSAVTYTNGNGEPRYSKGGNKIFQLSHHDPIGLMIYDSGQFLGVPWEIVIKDFRNELGRTSFDTVNEYASHFLEYVRSNEFFFPPAQRAEEFASLVSRLSIKFIVEAVKEHSVLGDAGSETEQRKQAWDIYESNVRSTLPAIADDLSAELPGLIEGARTGLREEMGKTLSAIDAAGHAKVCDFLSPEDLIGFAVETATRDYATHSSNTGLVFCGFGRNEHFPALVEHQFSGFVGSRMVSKEGESAKIDRNAPSEILQFATTSMVDVFTKGYGFDTWLAVGKAFRSQAPELIAKVEAAVGAKLTGPQLDQLLEESYAAFTRDWTVPLLNSNYVNLRSNIGTLPIDEMVHLAETMIVLESLKEKVTSPSQSVGGPVDIAAITRAEGLVWIKRKEYFSTAKNSRYALRQEQIYRSPGTHDAHS